MPTNHPFRYALVVVVIVFGFAAFLFVAPFLWYTFDMHRTRAHIRGYQNPEELRAWAQNLVAIYTSSNHIDTMPGLVTNRPPPGVPVSGRFPRVAVLHDHLPDGSYNQWHVGFLWGSGFMPGYGMMIGDTNFVPVNETKIEWKPGIYFTGPE